MAGAEEQPPSYVGLAMNIKGAMWGIVSRSALFASLPSKSAHRIAPSSVDSDLSCHVFLCTHECVI